MCEAINYRIETKKKQKRNKKETTRDVLFLFFVCANMDKDYQRNKKII